MKTFTVKQNTTLKQFTDDNYPQGSFVFSSLLKRRDIKVNGKKTAQNINLFCGDTVVYYTTAKEESKPSHIKVFEDENIYVADKYSGVSFEALLSELSLNGAIFGVHRLDRNTEGLLVFAKTEEAQEGLLNEFKGRKVYKKYIALLKNNFKVKEAKLTAYLLKDGKSSAAKIYDNRIEGSVKIETEYKVLEERGDIALAEIILHTGKTHQIRAHMAHIGCPVLGDEKYGDRLLNEKYSKKRQCLVSKVLKFSLADKQYGEFISSFNL